MFDIFTFIEYHVAHLYNKAPNRLPNRFYKIGLWHVLSENFIFMLIILNIVGAMFVNSFTIENWDAVWFSLYTCHKNEIGIKIGKIRKKSCNLDASNNFEDNSSLHVYVTCCRKVDQYEKENCPIFPLPFLK